VPREPLLVELDDNLRTLDIGKLSRYQIGLVIVLPLHEEHELAARVRRANDLLGQEVAVESTWARIVLVDSRGSGGGLCSRRALGLLLLGAGGRGARRVALGLSSALLLLEFGLVIGDEVGAVEILLGLPCVVGTEIVELFYLN